MHISYLHYQTYFYIVIWVIVKNSPLKALSFIVFLFVLTIIGCSKKDNVLPHQMYIWQRSWTPELAQSIQTWQNKLSALRILSVYTNHSNIQIINIDWALVPNDMPLTLVVRINGIILPDVNELASKLNQQIVQTSQHNVDTIEIDFDSPTSKLFEYSQWLMAFKRVIFKRILSKDLELSITTLPTWRNSKDLPHLLNNLDHYVLQVHSVLSADKGLFDKNLAIKWCKIFNQLSNTPFSISLPDYWYLAQLDNNNKIKALLAEGNDGNMMENKQQIFADPKNIHEAMQKIVALDLEHLKSWTWFRLPTSQDAMIFSDYTINELMSNKQTWQYKPVQMNFKRINKSSNFDLWISNPSNVEQPLQDQYFIPKNCKIKHLINSYGNLSTKIIAIYPQLIKAQSKKRIGWMTCQ